jgi:Meiotically up-regulated gene 113
MRGKIPYYVVRERNGRALGYWQPTKAMRDEGFVLVPCGPDGPEAHAIAAKWNSRWQHFRSENKADQVRSPSRDYGFVYFLRAGKRVKIGFSKNPFTRISDLRTNIADPLDNVVIFKGSRLDEQRLHRRLRAYRMEGEWFALSETTTKMMCRCSVMGADALDVESAQIENKKSDSVRLIVNNDNVIQS